MTGPPPHHVAIPAELCKGRIWACGRGWGKDKEPFIAGTHRHASATNPATWVSFEEAAAAYERGGFDALWRATRPDDGIVGIDLDHCVHGHAIDPWAMVYVRLLDSYTELTPSGEGLRIFAKAELPPGGRKRGPVECYDRDRFLSVTGNHLDGTPWTVEERQAEIKAFHRLVFWQEPPGPSRNEDGREGAADRRDGHDLDDDALIEKARKARNGEKFRALFDRGDISGYPSHSEADAALCSLIGFYARDEARIDRIFRLSALYGDKWERDTYRNPTISLALSARADCYTPCLGRSLSPARHRPVLRREVTV